MTKRERRYHSEHKVNKVLDYYRPFMDEVHDIVFHRGQITTPEIQAVFDKAYRIESSIIRKQPFMTEDECYKPNNNG